MCGGLITCTCFYLNPQQTSSGKCLKPLSVNVRPYNKYHNLKLKKAKHLITRHKRLGANIATQYVRLFLLIHAAVWGCGVLTGLGGWKMSAHPHISSHIADIGRQLNSPRVGCIIRNKDWDWFYLRLGLLLWSRHNRIWTRHSFNRYRRCMNWI